MSVLSRVMSVKFSVNFAVESGRGLSPRPAHDKYLHGKTEKRPAYTTSGLLWPVLGHANRRCNSESLPYSASNVNIIVIMLTLHDNVSQRAQHGTIEDPKPCQAMSGNA